MLLGLLVAPILALWILQLHRTTRRQERQIAELTRRVWTLEQASPQEPQPGQPDEIKICTNEPEKIEEIPEIPIRKEDWETRLGANWLNRIGALVLVIGIALFLGYSLTQLGAAGKIIIGAATGASLLAAGIASTRHPDYRNLSFSLMGAGWAVIYSTAYAAHALPAARIIESPATAALVLTAVSAAMIAHSIRYRSEPATALAYILGFVGLNVSPLTGFSVFATFLLAASLIAMSLRFDWYRLPIAGVLLTYGSFLLHLRDTNLAVNIEATLWTYWLAFEIYGIIQERRRSTTPILLALNAAGFVGTALLHSPSPTFLWIAAAAYMVTAVIRNNYSAPTTVAWGLMAAALIERLVGTTITLALIVEGELLFLAGLALRSRYMNALGAAGLGLALIRYFSTDVTYGASRTPIGLFLAAACIFNRYTQTSAAWYFTAAAAAVFAQASIDNFPPQYVSPVWAIAALIAFKTPYRDLQYIGAATAAFAWARAALVDINNHYILGAAVVIGALYALHPHASYAATSLLTLLIFNEVSGRLLTLALGAQAAALLIAGFLIGRRSLRLSGLALFSLCIGKLFLYDLRSLDTVSRILSFIVLGLVLLAASWVYTRYRDKITRLL